MNCTDLEAIAKAWIAYWHAPENSAEREELSWAGDCEYDMVREEANQAWLLILEILRKDASNTIQEVLSAGPLEDLLSIHGERIIDKIESEARSNPSFARLLGGVWKNSMSDEIWLRVQRVWDRRGWDGIPKA